jgi:hypothetical protein
MEKYSVLSPMGQSAVGSSVNAPRLQSLEGKTIGELWNGVFKGDVSFPVVRRLLQQRFPGLRIVPFTEFPHTHGSDNPADQRRRAEELAQLALDKGCDAVITGNGA